MTFAMVQIVVICNSTHIWWTYVPKLNCYAHYCFCAWMRSIADPGQRSVDHQWNRPSYAKWKIMNIDKFGGIKKHQWPEHLGYTFVEMHINIQSVTDAIRRSWWRVTWPCLTLPRLVNGGNAKSLLALRWSSISGRHILLKQAEFIANMDFLSKCNIW